MGSVFRSLSKPLLLLKIEIGLVLVCPSVSLASGRCCVMYLCIYICAFVCLYLCICVGFRGCASVSLASGRWCGMVVLLIRILRQLSVTDRTLAEKVGDRTGCMEASDTSLNPAFPDSTRPSSPHTDSASAITAHPSASPLQDGLWKFQNSSPACNKP